MSHSDSEFQIIDFLKKNKARFITFFVSLVAFLAALGTGFQNATAMIELLISAFHLAADNAWAIVLGVVAGGVCSTVINFCLNVQLLEDFWDRVIGRKAFIPYLPGGWRKLQYGLGVFAFIVTGLLFGLMAVAVGGTGGLAIAAMVAGILVTLVMIPQELETWLASFDHPVAVAIGKKIYDIKQLSSKEENQIPSLFEALKNELKEVLFKEKLKKLKENLLKEADEQKDNLQKQTLKNQAQVITHLILHLEKNKIDIDAFMDECEAKDSILKEKIKALNTEITTEQEKFVLKNDEKENVILELEAWKKEIEAQQPQTSISEGFKRWWRDLTFGRFVGLLISLGNVMALSLLFTIAITSFLASVGFGGLPALIIGVSVAFTFGAFTEFYFYHYFLADFCDHITYRWRELLHSPMWGLGILKITTNAIVNGVLACTGVILLETILATIGIAAPPLLILAITAGVFAGIASLLLGSDFWIKSAARFFTCSFGNKTSHENEIEDDSDTQPLLSQKISKEDILDTKSLTINDLDKKKTNKLETTKETWDWIFSPVTPLPEKGIFPCWPSTVGINGSKA